MHTILVRSTFVAFGSVAASLAIATTVVPMLGGTVDGTAWLMCVICPLVIAWPASAYAMLQQERLAAAIEAVERAHRDLAAAHLKLQEKARRDPLTGMLTRDAFFRAVNAAFESGGAGSILVIDADHFKSINDMSGHRTGDDALLELTHAICRAVGREGVIGRIGGEEFGAFLPAADEGKARLIGERIRREVEQVVFGDADGRRIALTVSLGGASHAPGKAVMDLLREADRRLYEAKRRGRNRLVFETDMARAA